MVVHNGITYSCHPSIGVSASVNELKKRGMWKKDARVVMSRGVISILTQKFFLLIQTGSLPCSASAMGVRNIVSICGCIVEYSSRKKKLTSKFKILRKQDLFLSLILS